MAASARPGERATSFAVACSLLSRFVRQNGAAAADLGLGIKGEHRNPAVSAGRVCPVVRPGSSCSSECRGRFRNLGGSSFDSCGGRVVRSGRGLGYPVWKPRFRASNFALPYPALFFFFSGEVEQQRMPATINLLPGTEGEEAERRKETMELFPQSAGFGVKDAAAPRCVLLLYIIYKSISILVRATVVW